MLTFTGGNIDPGGQCSFIVTLQIPVGVTAGTYPNTTSVITGVMAEEPITGNVAEDDLVIEPPPAFSKTFVPDTITSGGISTLTFTIDNTASSLAATALVFTDNLPAGIAVANPSNAGTTCTGGLLTAVPGTGTITYTGGSFAAGATCSISVDVTGSSVGTFINTTGNLTSSAGNSGTASDTLTIEASPSVPTLSGWGLVILAILLGISGIILMQKKLRVTM